MFCEPLDKEQLRLSIENFERIDNIILYRQENTDREFVVNGEDAHPISKYEQKKSRSKKKMESRKEQKNLNDKNARKNLRRRIHANFDNRDLIVSLSYDAANLPNSEEAAIRDRNNYIRRIKNFRKRNGLDELKYIAVLEYREATDDKRTKTRIHHHIIISGMDRDKAEELWGKGTANANRMQANERGFEELANYLLKDPRGKKRWIFTSWSS